MNSINFVKTSSIARITLSKAPLNILDIEDLLRLSALFAKFKTQKDIKAIIIESDQKIFSAGVNVAEHTKENINRMLKAFMAIYFNMLEVSIPTISLVKSDCIGGACELALFCDFVLTDEKANFSLPEIKLGCYPPAALAFLPYIVGNKKALEIILTGRTLSAKEALDLGLVNQVFPTEKFEAEAENYINNLISNSPSVIRTTLAAYKRMHYNKIRKKLELAEKLYFEELMLLDDAVEGINSFLEKREPIWTGR